MNEEPKLHQRVDLRKSHPLLFHLSMAIAVGSLVLALNFWFFAPAFDPYGVPKAAVGVVFAIIGTALLTFMTLYRDLRLVRFSQASSTLWMLFWGCINTKQFFDGNASLQLPLVFFTLAAMQIAMLIESPVNPMTEKK